MGLPINILNRDRSYREKKLLSMNDGIIKNNLSLKLPVEFKPLQKMYLKYFFKYKSNSFQIVCTTLLTFVV